VLVYCGDPLLVQGPIEDVQASALTAAGASQGEPVVSEAVRPTTTSRRSAAQPGSQ